MSNIGSARNARLNQARKHAVDLLTHLSTLSGHTKHQHIENPDAWQDARNELEKLTQCVHEANAYNNAMEEQS